jgi:hypothetical protein
MAERGQCRAGRGGRLDGADAGDQRRDQLMQMRAIFMVGRHDEQHRQAGDVVHMAQKIMAGIVGPIGHGGLNRLSSSA